MGDFGRYIGFSATLPRHFNTSIDALYRRFFAISFSRMRSTGEGWLAEISFFDVVQQKMTLTMKHCHDDDGHYHFSFAPRHDARAA